jgi:lysozyme family protein
MEGNFGAALSFVWQQQFDSPAQGFHVSTGDPGKGTFGGVIQTTWDDAVRAGIVKGQLIQAGPDQLSTVLRARFWGSACNALPAGLDLLFFNGRMMSGRFPWLFQSCLGFMGSEDVDGMIGPETLAAVKACDGGTLIDAVSGVHAGYLATLDEWPRFGGGWTTRLKAAQAAALAMTDAVPVA